MTDQLREEFRSPPADEFGNVPFWWWDGDRLDEDRITDQLETLSDRGVEAVCFEQKYPHGSPEGPDAPYFSEEWWTYMEHAVAECDRLGMDLWIHDETYHHSPPSWKRYWQDHVEELSEDEPALRGRIIDRVATDVEPGETVTLSVDEGFSVLSAAAYPRTDTGVLSVDGAVQVDVSDDVVDDRGVDWTAPDDVTYHVAVVGTREEGLCRTTRDVVDRILDLHYGEYVDRLGDALGDPIVGTFQDELYMLQGTVPCDRRLLARYRAEWDEDPLPELIRLFEDCGEGTTAFRTRYYDVVTTMLEENWFQPLYEWHERRGLRFAHDNWGRNDLTEHATEYGDYVRTMRWFQEPGYDDGKEFEGVGTRNFFDGKLASSIAACYGRGRVWGELFHTTGWGFPPSLQLAGIAENACYGLTRYNMHGLYYATLGGWYEHAPPDAHFRQPYWEHADAFNDAVRRLMFLFSRGSPVVDLAMLYPITSVQAHRLAAGVPEINAPGGRHPVEFEPEGRTIDELTREFSESLYDDVADLLFVDHETLAESTTTTDGRLAFAGVEAPVFVLGPTTTVRRAVLSAAVEHVENGGVIVAAGGLPSATVEGGERDDALDDALARLFGPEYGASTDELEVVERDHGGVGILVPEASTTGLRDVLSNYVDLDVDAPGDVYRAHRRVDDTDVYLLLNTRDEPRSIEIGLRATGQPELWDVHSGEIEPIREFERDGEYTRMELDFATHEFHVVAVDGSESPRLSVVDTSLSEVTGIVEDGESSVVTGYAAESGRHEATAAVDGDVRVGETDESVVVPDPIALDGGWTFELEPTLHNRWGDFRYPASDERVGVEVREFRWRCDPSDGGTGDDGVDAIDAPVDEGENGDWTTVRWSYGPRFWHRTATTDDPADVTTPDEDADEWEPYTFSTTQGKPGTHHDDHGLSGTVSDEFLVAPEGDGPAHFWTTVRNDEARTVACHHGSGIRSLRVDGQSVDVPADATGTVEVDVPAGSPSVHLVVEPGVATHVVFEPLPATTRERDMAYVPRLRWFHESDALAFDHRPWESAPTNRFRFSLPAGATAFTVPTDRPCRVWVDETEASVDGGRVAVAATAEPRTVTVVVVGEPGEYGGAVLTGPVAVETEPIEVTPGDWRDLGLDAYSGIGVYRTTVTVPTEADDGRVVLDLGDVAVSASVRVNGEHAGTTFAPPYQVDVTGVVEPGENEVTVRVANTVANHFETEVPTRYVYSNQTRSGMLGSVELRILPTVRIDV